MFKSNIVVRFFVIVNYFCKSQLEGSHIKMWKISPSRELLMSQIDVENQVLAVAGFHLYFSYSHMTMFHLSCLLS